MKTKVDTSINIDRYLLERITHYSNILGLTKQELIFKVLAHFIKRSRSGIFIKRRTVGYQLRKGNYKKVTLHLDPIELEIFTQIRVVTLLSTSYVFFIAMDLFGDKLFKRANKSSWTYANLLNYKYWGSYPEYDLFIRKTITLFRYQISYLI
jgi:hypothetical protein